MKEFIVACSGLILCSVLAGAIGALHTIASFDKLLDVDYQTLSKEKRDCESAIIRSNNCVAVIYFEERVSEE